MRARVEAQKMKSLTALHQEINKFMSKVPNLCLSLEESNSIPSMEDALQAIETIIRPKAAADIETIGATLLNAVLAAGNDAHNWKLLALTIVHRRYHSKAPEAKLELRNKDSKETDIGSGHGERLSFYVIILYFQAMARNAQLLQLNNFALKACECLARLALPAGGTRDICALIEHLLYEELDLMRIFEVQKEKGNKRALCQAVNAFVVVQEDGTNASQVLTDLVQIAKDLIDQDMKIIDSKTGNSESNSESNGTQIKRARLDKSENEHLQSTINTFIPHHNRGSNARKLVQTTAELMIWSRTEVMKANKTFSSSLDELSSIGTDDDVKVIHQVHILQTAIRRMRKKLNASSRDQGFSLCTSFKMNPDTISADMIKTAKHGDLKRLRELATKAQNKTILWKLANGKAVPVSSIPELRSSWVRIDKNDEELDDFLRLRLQMQENTVNETIQALRKKIPTENSKGDIIIASLDRKPDLDSAAILVAAALENKSTNEDGEFIGNSVALYLGEDKCNISSLSEVTNLLDQTFADESASNSIIDETSRALATTKDVQNLIERHLKPDDILLLFAEADVKLEQRVLAQLQKQGSSVHCHIIDEFAVRMDREKAKVGDITVTLAWDNECDLDLSVQCPNGDLISYQRKTGGSETGGGFLDVDMNVTGQSKVPVENIFFGDAENGISADSGHYKVMVRNYRYHGRTVKNGDPVPWRVRVSKNGENSFFTGACVGTMEASEKIVVEFDYTPERKKQPIETVGTALSSSNLVNVTSSQGSSLDSIAQLMALRQDRTELETVRELLHDLDHSTDNPNETQLDAEATRPLMADNRSFDITNRERLFLKLSKLPSCFHLEVDKSFEGGSTLLDYTASILAKRLIDDRIHTNELRNNGYPENLIEMVQKKMTTFGV
jgi:hypothetical protein